MWVEQPILPSLRQDETVKTFFHPRCKLLQSKKIKIQILNFQQEKKRVTEKRKFYMRILHWNNLINWYLSDCNWTLTYNHLVRKRTLNHLAKLALPFIVLLNVGYKYYLCLSLELSLWDSLVSNFVSNPDSLVSLVSNPDFLII